MTVTEWKKAHVLLFITSNNNAAYASSQFHYIIFLLYRSTSSIYVFVFTGMCQIVLQYITQCGGLEKVLTTLRFT